MSRYDQTTLATWSRAELADCCRSLGVYSQKEERRTARTESTATTATGQSSSSGNGRRGRPPATGQASNPEIDRQRHSPAPPTRNPSPASTPRNAPRAATPVGRRHPSPPRSPSPSQIAENFARAARTGPRPAEIPHEPRQSLPYHEGCLPNGCSSTLDQVVPVRVAYAMTYHHPYPGTHNTYPFAGFQLRMLDQYGLWDVRTSPMFIVRADWKVIMAGSRNFRLGRNTAGEVYLSFDRPSQSRPGQSRNSRSLAFRRRSRSCGRSRRARSTSWILMVISAMLPGASCGPIIAGLSSRTVEQTSAPSPLYLGFNSTIPIQNSRRHLCRQRASEL